MIIVPDARLNGISVQASLTRDWALSTSAADEVFIVASDASSHAARPALFDIDRIAATAEAKKQYLSRVKPNLVLVESLFSLISDDEIGWASIVEDFGLSCTVRIHEMIPLEGSSTLWTKPAPPVHQFFPRPDSGVAFIIPTNVSRRHYTAVFGGDANVAVIPIAVDRRRLMEPRPMASSDILQPGTIYLRKGPLRTIESFAKVSREFPRSNLIFAGPTTSHVRPVSHEIKRLGLTSRVHILGPKEAIGQLYRSAALTTLHSAAESTPTVAIESVLSGRPFVGTAVGGVRELLQGTSAQHHLFDYGDTDRQAFVMGEVLRDPTTAYGRTLLDREVLLARHDIDHVGPKVIAACESVG